MKPMADKIQQNLTEFKAWLANQGWKVIDQRLIEHGQQIVVSDGFNQLPVNFYQTGRILTQGKASTLKTAVTEWSNLLQAGIKAQPAESATKPQNRIARYLVLSDNLEAIKAVVQALPGEVSMRTVSGPAELYRAEVRQDHQRITITQYGSGMLMVQGASGSQFDLVCEVLDQHLDQSFTDRAARFIPAPTEQVTATIYLAKPEAENEATQWLLGQIDRQVLEFLYPNDQSTLIAAAGVRNAYAKPHEALPDYSVIVMPFAKAYEGFVIRLAVHLGLTDQETLKQKANEIEIGNWLEAIRIRLPDIKRYVEISDTLNAAWGCRNKAVHSDPAHPLSVLKSFSEAEQEISTILRAMARAHRVFVIGKIPLTPTPGPKSKANPEKEKERPFEHVDRDALRAQLVRDGVNIKEQPEGRKNLWELDRKPELLVIAPRQQDGIIIVKGTHTEEFKRTYHSLLEPKLESVPLAPTIPSEISVEPKSSIPSVERIGIDESGKGDLFGPLVIAGVRVTQETEELLARRGVRDSKALSDSAIVELAALIREHCEFEVLVLLPPDYNAAYQEHGRNLNHLLAWGHAQVITHLSKRTETMRAISDQFGDEQLLIKALEDEQCLVVLEQRPRAESDIAVAAASILARAEFVAAIEDYTRKAGVTIPLGASATQVKEIGKLIYKRWGERGLERIAKMHFKTIQEIVSEVDA